jgi:hypothetical protein
MTPTLEEQLRDELREAAAMIWPPSDLVDDVSRRLHRRFRRRVAMASVAAVAGAALATVIVVGQPGARVTTAHPHPHRSPQLRPSVVGPLVVHGATLTDTTSGRVLPAIRTVTLPGGRSPLHGVAYGDTLYADSALSDGHDFSEFERLVRVAGRTGRVIISSARMRSPTTPYVAFGLVWVADANRLLGFDPTTLVVRRTVTMPGDLAGQVTSAGGYLWVAGWTHLDRVDPSSGQLTQIAPTQADNRYAGVAANAGGTMLFAGIKKLPEITTNLGSLTSLNPTTGAVITTRSRPGITDGIAGVVDGEIWVGDHEGGTGGQVDQVNATSFAVNSPFMADNDISVVVSDGVPWISAANLDGRSGQSGALFECADPTTGTVRGQISLHKYPGRSANQLPATRTTSRPFFLAAGPHEIFATVDQILVIYRADPTC